MSHLAPSASFYHVKLNCLQAEMKRFTVKIVDMMKQESLYASQGGPIILSQVFLHFYSIHVNFIFMRIYGI